VQLRELVQFHQRTEVSYCRLAAVSVDPPQVQEAFKAGLGAQFPFLSDTKLILTDELGIRETTDKRHGSLPVPTDPAAVKGDIEKLAEEFVVPAASL
jgi:peroxiredoxin